MSTILAIDTSTEACSVALERDGDIAELFDVIPRRHAGTVLPMVEQLLAETDCGLEQLDAIAFGRGPGSFTGLRIAAGVVQGLAYGLDIPVIPVSTLEALASQAGRRFGASCVVSCLDARIGEVYWGLYEIKEQRPQIIGEECLSLPGKVKIPEPVQQRSWFGAGNGWQLENGISQLLKIQVTDRAPDMLPHAEDIAALAAIRFQQGCFQMPDQAAPVYLRDKVTR